MKPGLAELFRGVWALCPVAFQAICRTLESGIDADAKSVRWASGGRAKPGAKVAVLPIHGLIDQRPSWVMDFLGGTPTDLAGMAFDELMNDPQVKGVILDVDSPGGSSVGAPVLAEKIYQARDRKPVVAVANAEMNSAAYWIGSAASKVFIRPDGYAGSVGVWSAAGEYSKQLAEDGVTVHVWRSAGSPYKAEMLPWKEFSQEAIDNEQAQVDRIYGDFLSAVSRNRGVSESIAQKNFGQGRSLDARAALASGLVDRIATLDQVISRMDSGRLSLSSMENMAEWWDEPDGWQDRNATERLRLDLRRRGFLQKA